MKIDYSEYEWNEGLCGKISIPNENFNKKINVEIHEDDNAEVRDESKRLFEFFLDNYAKYGFGLWAVILKETGEFIGDCGITIQKIDGNFLPEIGYHINKKYWRRGFAREAAQAVRDWAFKNTEYPSLYSYCRNTNEASYKTAEAIGMHFDKEYTDESDEITHVSVIHRTDIEAAAKQDK